MEKYCSCGDSLTSTDGKNRRGSINKKLCWVCDMDENPEAYQIIDKGKHHVKEE